MSITCQTHCSGIHITHVVTGAIRFHACVWSLSSLYFPSIYSTYMIKGVHLCVISGNVIGKKALKHCFVLNSGKGMKLCSANEGTL